MGETFRPGLERLRLAPAVALEVFGLVAGHGRIGPGVLEVGGSDR